MSKSQCIVCVRPAQPSDLAAITALYNHYVTKTIVNFDVEAFSVEARRGWFAQFSESGRYQLFVAEIDGRFGGYTGSMRYKEKPAYQTSVEATVYVEPSFAGQGVGKALYRRLFAALEKEDVRLALAGVALPNDASLAFHRRFGFEEIGVFREVGRKFGRYHDVLWMQKRFG